MNELGGETGVLSFGCMHPDFDGWKEELARVQRLGPEGDQAPPEYQGTDFDDPRYLRILDRCGELGLVVLTHAGLDIGMPGKDNCAPEMVARTLDQVGPVKLVLAHMGGWRQWDRVEALLPGRGSIWTPPSPWGRSSPWTTATTGPGPAPAGTRGLPAPGAQIRGGSGAVRHRQPLGRSGRRPGPPAGPAPGAGRAGRHPGGQRPGAAGHRLTATEEERPAFRRAAFVPKYFRTISI